MAVNSSRQGIVRTRSERRALRRTQPFVKRLAAGATALAIGLLAPLAVAPAAQAASLGGIATSFEIDGNVAGAFDWAGLPYGAGVTPDGDPTTGIVYHNEVIEACEGDDSGLTESSVNTMSQSIHDYPWVIGDGTAVTTKSDLCSAAVAVEIVDVDGQQHFILYQNWSRSGEGTGDLSIFYSFQGGAAGADGDRLLEFNFDPSSGIELARWVWNGSGFTKAADSLVFDAATGVHPNWVDPEPDTFGEFAIDLTANGLLSEETCATFQTGDIATRTGNSGPANSQLEDFIDVPSQSLIINNCNGLSVEKVVNGAAPAGLTFPYVIEQLDGMAVHGPEGASGPVADTDASVASISAAIAAGETHAWSEVLAQPDYRVAELVDSLPDGVTAVSVVCTYQDWFAPGHPMAEVTVWQGGSYTGEVFPILPSGIGAAPPSCVITNQVTSLTLDKIVVNDHGGAAVGADFTLTATPTGGGAAVIDGIDTDSDAGSTLAAIVTPGGYTLSESTLAGYTGGAWSCAGGTIAGDVVTVPEGVGVVCTVVNDDLPATLTLVKAVTNDDGGTLDDTDFTLHAAGTTPLSGVEGSPAVTDAVVAAGAYTIGETPMAGYLMTGTLCWTDSTRATTVPVAAGGTITLANGGSAYCEVSNDDQPGMLTLLKHVTNDDGGTAVATDWTLTATGPTPGVSGAGGVAAVSVAAGDYALTETGGPDGYAASDWSCTGGTLEGSTVTVALGAEVTCEITNDDIAPGLTLVKQVVNDHGGTAAVGDWQLTAVGGDTTITGVTADPAVTGADVPAGTYELSESGPAGYAMSDWVCDGGTQPDATSITLSVGESAICTITNDDLAPTLTLRKEVVNDDGGTAVDTDWTLGAVGPTLAVSGVEGDPSITAREVAAGDYTLSESVESLGYAASAWSCTAGTLVGSVLTLGLGEHAVCTITNDDIAPMLTLVKAVVNDDGGDALETDWVLSADGPTPLSGVTGDAAVTDVVVEAGEYVLAETGPAGYSAGMWECSDGMLEGSSLLLRVGETAVCTIVNDDEPIDLQLTKDDGGVNAAAGGEFDYTITVTNIGDRPVDGDEPVTVVDELPVGFTLADGPASCTADGQVVTCDVDPALLLPGESVVIVLTVAVAPETPAGSYVNFAMVTTEDDEPPGDADCESESNNVDCEETPVFQGVVAAVKSAWELVDGNWVASDGVVAFGDEVQYQIVVTASGEATSTGVVVVDELQDGLVSADPATCSVTCTATYDAATGIHRVEIGMMLSGDTVTITFLVDVPEAPAHAAGTTVSETFDNVAAVASDIMPETPTNTVTVKATHVLAPPPQLPRTGAELPIGLIGVALALMTGGALLMIRRRKSAPRA